MYLELTPSSPCMNLAIAVFLDWCEKKKEKKAASPLMTINEYEGEEQSKHILSFSKVLA